MELIALTRCWRFSTGEHDELDKLGESFRIFPTWQRIPLIAAHDPEETGIGKSCRHGLGGFERVTRAGLMEFEIIDDRPRQVFGGEAEHFAAVLAARRLAARFVGRNPAGEEADFVEVQRVLRQPGEMEMPEVDGIESAAEQGDFSRRGHGRRRLGGNVERFNLDSDSRTTECSEHTETKRVMKKHGPIQTVEFLKSIPVSFSVYSVYSVVRHLPFWIQASPRFTGGGKRGQFSAE